MADYKAKTNWLPDDPINEDDLNRWEEGIAAANKEGDEHRNNKQNPHSVTKAQLGLNQVENVRQAPKVDFDAHRDNKQNPHEVSKSQVGLSNVQNYPIATQAQAEAGTHSASYMTPQRAKDAINLHNADFLKHVTGLGMNAFTAESNPSEYPFGLSFFFTDSSNLEFPDQYVFIITHRDTNTSGQPRLSQTAQAIGDSYGRIWTRGTRSGAWGDWTESESSAGAQSKVNTHENKKNNPHNVTKAQVGLSNIDNVQQATKVEFNGHLNDKTNPHAVTKAQVGLNNVENVKQATKTEFDSFTNRRDNPHNVTSEQVILGPVRAANISGNEYPNGLTSFMSGVGISLGYPHDLILVMTLKNGAHRLQQFVYHASSGRGEVYYRGWRQDNGWDDFTQQETTTGSQAKVDEHGSLRNNPHNVTKNQVGLSSVQNYPIATQAQAEAGNHTTSYMNPQRTKEAIHSLATSDLVTSFPLNWKSASDLPSTYQKGVTIFPANAENGGWPTRYSMIMTIYGDNAAVVQYCTQWSGNGDRIWVRNSQNNESVWRNWIELETVAGAQSKVNATQVHKVTTDDGGGILLSSGRNLDTVFDAGFYRVQNAVNRPSDSSESWGYVIVNKQGTSEAMQIYIPFSNRIMYIRSSSNTGVWRDWVRYATQEELKAHTDSTNNPHNVTKTQVGLSNVDNIKQAPESRNLTAGNGLSGGGNLSANRTFELGTPGTITNSTTNSVSGASHTHSLSISKGDIGLGNVQDFIIALKNEAEAGNVSNRYMTPLRTKEAIQVLATSDLINNIGGNKSLSDSISSFPYGISLSRLPSGGPDNLGPGILLTIRHSFSSTAGHQMFYPTHESLNSRHYTRYVSNSSGGWTNWSQFETTSGAQSKVNAHENKSNNPHNVTTEQVNKFSDSYRSGSASPTTYPVGISLFSIGDDKSWSPLQYGQVLTIKTGTYRVYQELIGTGNGLPSINKYHRWGYDGKWTDFYAGAGEPFEFHRASLLNGWSHHSSWPVQYGMDGSGTVWIKGAMHGGVNGGNPPRHQFVLPGGYRPSSTTYFVLNGQPSGDTQGTVRLQIQTNGIALLQHLSHPGAAQWVAVDLSFKAATNGDLK